MTDELDRMASRFVRFAEQEACASSPLYERLSRAIAGDPAMLALATLARPGQPAPNLLFAAVQYLLLKGARSPLAAFYPRRTGRPAPADDPYPYFRQFCRAHEAQIAALLSTRRVQTNEVGRAACLLPAFGLVAHSAGDQALALVEIGTSAGLLLLWDRYGYEYGDGRMHGDINSPVRIVCARRGTAYPPVPAPFPPVASRLGLDLAPVDARDPEQALWLRALVWPEHAQRAEQLGRAMDVARQSPPPLRAGPALTLLPQILAAATPAAALCVFHCFTLNQWPRDDRARLTSLLAEYSRRRNIYHVSLEFHGDTYPELRLAAYARGVATEAVLARCQAHGEWIEWLAP